MFRPNCRAIFRLIFVQVECILDNAFKAYKVVYDCIKYYVMLYFILFYLCSLVIVPVTVCRFQVVFEL